MASRKNILMSQNHKDRANLVIDDAFKKIKFLLETALRNSNFFDDLFLDTNSQSKEWHNLININYKNIYDCVTDATLIDCASEKIKWIFAFYHSKLDSLFSILNKKVCPRGGHYCASDSRELLESIDNIENLYNDLLQTLFEFSIDSEYVIHVEKCKEFLHGSGGSDFPPMFNKIKIKKYEKIFNLKNKNDVINPDEETLKILRHIATQDDEYQEWTHDTKLENLNKAIEHLLKKPNEKYKEIDETNLFCSFITNENIKIYRNKTHCFRHGSEENLIQRDSYNLKQKEFLIQYGVLIINTILKEGDK